MPAGARCSLRTVCAGLADRSPFSAGPTAARPPPPTAVRFPPPGPGPGSGGALVRGAASGTWGPSHSRSQRRSTRCTCSAPTRSASSSTGADRATGDSRKGRAWAPPSPPCEPICSSKARTSPSFGSYEELTMMSATCGKECVRRTASAAPGPKSASGPGRASSSLSTGTSAPFAPSTSPPYSSLRTSTNPTPGWLARVDSSAGWRRSISSRLIRCGTSGKETRPRLPEASTMGSERREDGAARRAPRRVCAARPAPPPAPRCRCGSAVPCAARAGRSRPGPGCRG